MAFFSLIQILIPRRDVRLARPPMRAAIVAARHGTEATMAEIGSSVTASTARSRLEQVF
jgi:hypothetical protein